MHLHAKHDMRALKRKEDDSLDTTATTSTKPVGRPASVLGLFCAAAVAGPMNKYVITECDRSL
jgi:hypothetical protein